MDFQIIFILLVILLLLSFFVLFYLNNKKKENERIDLTYKSKEGEFDILGVKSEFVVMKNKKIEFLVKDGQIIACRDLRVGNEFIYYGDK